MDEVNRRNNSSRFRPGIGKSNTTFSGSNMMSSGRFGGSKIRESRISGSILSSKTEGKPPPRKFDLRERPVSYTHLTLPTKA